MKYIILFWSILLVFVTPFFTYFVFESFRLDPSSIPVLGVVLTGIGLSGIMYVMTSKPKHRKRNSEKNNK